MSRTQPAFNASLVDCRHFIRKECENKECRYRHNKSCLTTTEVCMDYTRGECKEPESCPKRHPEICQFDSKPNGCRDWKCLYHHLNPCAQRPVTMSYAVPVPVPFPQVHGMNRFPPPFVRPQSVPPHVRQVVPNVRMHPPVRHEVQRMSPMFSSGRLPHPAASQTQPKQRQGRNPVPGDPQSQTRSQSQHKPEKKKAVPQQPKSSDVPVRRNRTQSEATALPTPEAPKEKPKEKPKTGNMRRIAISDLLPAENKDTATGGQSDTSANTSTIGSLAGSLASFLRLNN